MNLRWYQRLLSSSEDNETGDLFGWALASGNFNSDEHDDLAISAAGESYEGIDQAGRIHVLYGPFSPLESYYTFTETHESGIQFGYSLAAGDFDDNGYDDVVIGAPFYGYGSLPDNAGQVVVYFFYEGDIMAQFLYMDSLIGDAIQPVENDQFGLVLAVLDEPNYNQFIYLPLIRR